MRSASDVVFFTTRAGRRGGSRDEHVEAVATPRKVLAVTLYVKDSVRAHGEMQYTPKRDNKGANITTTEKPSGEQNASVGHGPAHVKKKKTQCLPHDHNTSHDSHQSQNNETTQKATLRRSGFDASQIFQLHLLIRPLGQKTISCPTKVPSNNCKQQDLEFCTSRWFGGLVSGVVRRSGQWSSVPVV